MNKKFKVGDLVHYKDDPLERGIIISIRTKNLIDVTVLYEVYWFGYESDIPGTSTSDQDFNNDYELCLVTKETK